MIIYIKNENGTISPLSTAEIMSRLTKTTSSGAINPYLIGYIHESSTHFLFAMQQGQLCRFGIRSTEETAQFFQLKKMYFSMPAYHIYDEKNQLFSPTPLPGRFTDNRDFTLDDNLFLTPDEITQHCSHITRTIHVDSDECAQCPELPSSSVTEQEDVLAVENDAIFRFIYTLFGVITHYEDNALKTSIHILIQSEGMLLHKSPLLQALTDYRDTLLATDNTLHFSPRYQAAYNNLSAAYPILDNGYIHWSVLKKLTFAHKMLRTCDRVMEIRRSDQITLNSMDCVYLRDYLTTQDLCDLLTSRQKQLSTALTNMHDIHLIFTHYPERELGLLFSLLSKELALLIQNNRAEFNTLFSNDKISAAKKAILLWVLPVKTVMNILSDSNDIAPKKNAIIFEQIIKMRNIKVNSAESRSELFCTAPAAPYDLTVLLAAIHLILLNYTVTRREGLQILVREVLHDTDATVQSTLTRLKILSGVNGANQHGRLDKVIKMIGNAFEKKAAIDLECIWDLSTPTSWRKALCCA